MTGVMGWLTARWFRRRWLSAAPMLLLVATGATATAIAVSAAQRTSHAYADYLDRAEVGDLVINPSIATRQISDAIHGLPGVERITSDVLLQTTLDDGEPRTRLLIDQNGSDMYVFGSTNGRYVDMDRPIVVEGRMATNDHEAVVTAEAAVAEQLAVGDTTPISFWPMQISDGLTPEELQRFVTEEIEPLAVESVTIVGIVRMPDEVLPDDLYPRQRMIVAPQIAARHTCLPDEPPAGTSLEEVKRLVVRDDCSLGYEYHSIEFVDGAAGVAPALEAFLVELDERNAHLATYTGISNPEEAPTYFLVTSETDRERQRVERANRPIVAAAWVAALAAGAATLVLFGLAVARASRRSGDDLRQWHRLGVSRAMTTVAAAAPTVIAVVAGSVVGLVLGWWFDPGPLGLVAAVEPGAPRRLLPVTAAAVGAMAIVELLGGVLLTIRSVRHASAPEATTEGQRSRRLPVTTSSPVVTDAIRSAYGQRTSPSVIVGVALMVTALVAAIVFGASLDRLLRSPVAYGWPWDSAAMLGGGYGGVDPEQLEQLLGDDANVAGWSVLGFTNEVALNGQPLMSVVDYDVGSTSSITVLEGEMPDDDDEIALGRATASDRGVQVGDTVQLGIYEYARPVTVTALVVFPSLGPIFSERTGTGTGMLLPQAVFEVPELDWLLGELLSLRSFVGVDLIDADAESRDAMERTLSQLSSDAAAGDTVPTAIRPPEIIDAGSTRRVPLAVEITLASLAVVALGFSSWASVKARRREIAVLRSLGFSDEQVRRSVRLQSAVTASAALVIGVPVGIITGRGLWRAFADQLGVLPDPANPTVPLALSLVGGVIAAIVAAELPASMSTRAAPAKGLRTE